MPSVVKAKWMSRRRTRRQRKNVLMPLQCVLFYMTIGLHIKNIRFFLRNTYVQQTACYQQQQIFVFVGHINSLIFFPKNVSVPSNALQHASTRVSCVRCVMSCGRALKWATQRRLLKGREQGAKFEN